MYICLCVYHLSVRTFLSVVSYFVCMSVCFCVFGCIGRSACMYVVSFLSVVCHVVCLSVCFCVFGCIGRFACMYVVCLAVCFLSVCQSLWLAVVCLLSPPPRPKDIMCALGLGGSYKTDMLNERRTELFVVAYCWKTRYGKRFT